jgi:hypothetical protein
MPVAARDGSFRVEVRKSEYTFELTGRSPRQPSAGLSKSANRGNAPVFLLPSPDPLNHRYARFEELESDRFGMHHRSHACACHRQLDFPSALGPQNSLSLPRDQSGAAVFPIKTIGENVSETNSNNKTRSRFIDFVRL